MGKVGRRGPSKGRIEQRKREAELRDEFKAERERLKREYEALPEKEKAEIEAKRRERQRASDRRFGPIMTACLGLAASSGFNNWR